MPPNDEKGMRSLPWRDEDMIKVNGMSVFPSEVETILARHELIESVAVVPRPDVRRGQVPVAYVRLVDGASVSAEELSAWAASNMATYKVPSFELVDEFPMTTTGKIRKVELAARAAAESGAATN